MNITINVSNEIVATWLGELFREEAEQARGAASNEEMFALGSDEEEAEQHMENAASNLEYAEILEDAHKQVQKYFGGINTRITYLYRDASNYKKHNEIVVKGELSQAQADYILSQCLNDYCEDEEMGYFIPEQLGLPAERFDDLTGDDHCWFELWSGFAEETTALPTVDISADELARKFQEAKRNGWDDVKYAIVA